jgi:predicted hydrocarbon binding protein
MAIPASHSFNKKKDAYSMLKKLGVQKGLKNLNIDSDSHIIYKKTNLSLVVLRPNDLAQMGDLIGQGNKDIITWIGKTVGRSVAEIVYKDETPKSNDELITKSFKALESLGFGILNLTHYQEDVGFQVKVESPLYESLDENQEIISNIYLGIFFGVLEYLGRKVSGIESEAAWKNKNINYSTYDMKIEGAATQ